MFQYISGTRYMKNTFNVLEEPSKCVLRVRIGAAFTIARVVWHRIKKVLSEDVCDSSALDSYLAVAILRVQQGLDYSKVLLDKDTLLISSLDRKDAEDKMMRRNQSGAPLCNLGMFQVPTKLLFCYELFRLFFDELLSKMWLKIILKRLHVVMVKSALH